MRFASVDVDYHDDRGTAAAAVFADWAAAEPEETAVASVPVVAEYRRGFFYKRELPCILAVLERLTAPFDVVVVDGYAWLGRGWPGLGEHLYRALDRRWPVIGVAKSRFGAADAAIEVWRGESARPLYVSASGVEPAEAARWVETMAGPHRLPTALKRVDSLAREAARQT